MGGGSGGTGGGGEAMKAQAYLPVHTAPVLWGGLCLLLSLCFTSTETIWFIRDGCVCVCVCGGGGGDRK